MPNDKILENLSTIKKPFHMDIKTRTKKNYKKKITKKINEGKREEVFFKSEGEFISDQSSN